MVIHVQIISSCLILVLCSQFSLLFFPSSAAGGEIFDQCVADNDEAFTEKDVIRLAKQILTGVTFLHRNNVVHLDLKVSPLKDYMTIEDSLFPQEGMTALMQSQLTQCIMTLFPQGSAL